MKKILTAMIFVLLLLPAAVVYGETIPLNPGDSSFDQAVEKMAREQEAARANPIAGNTIMGFTVPAFFGAIIFSTIGLYGFLQGRKRKSLRFYLLGIALMGFTYLVHNTVLMFVIGGILTLLLFWPRE